MSKNNVYISYSIPNEHYAKEVAEFLKHKGTNPVYWKMELLMKKSVYPNLTQ